MAINPDRFILPVQDRDGSPERLAALLGAPWEPAGSGQFARVYINDGLTAGFLAVKEPIRPHHYCLRVDEQAFDAIFDRIEVAGLKYRSRPQGADDMTVNTRAPAERTSPGASPATTSGKKDRI